MMNKAVALFFSMVNLFSVQAQSESYGRCEIRRSEDVIQFEHWLRSKQSRSATTQTLIYRVPVVVHVLHLGDSVGEGFNFPASRVESQISTLNEDFGRKEDTPGFNSHPDGGNPQIEFILAQVDPEGNPTDGIVRVDMNSVHLPQEQTGDIITTCSQYSYWNPDRYLNVWSMPTGLPPGLFLGSGRFPVSDLEGLGAPSADGDGIFINASNFGQGETNIDPNYSQGRSLTHEMGHFLGLLHTFGSGGCQYSDHCADTPPIESATNGCPSVKPFACDGRPAMIENYMDYSYDRCMNIFTKDQIARMHTVLENSPRRKSLLTSPVLITSVEDDFSQLINVYPNPVTDKLFVSIGGVMLGHSLNITAYTLLGQVLFKHRFTGSESIKEIQVSNVQEKAIILTIEGQKLFYRQLLLVN